uniref:Uncharacterized protein n=1 Tax=Arundo donax TaxID=35708 RepID=A0A0A9DXC7_ARUDO
MLFILVMDVLNSVLAKAANDGLLQPLSNRQIGHRVSMYADDVVLFLQPVPGDLELVKHILERFGGISGLHTNIQKCSATPIQCSPVHIDTVRELLPCNIVDFPCTYLGLPLGLETLKGCSPTSH